MLLQLNRWLGVPVGVPQCQKGGTRLSCSFVGVSRPFCAFTRLFVFYPAWLGLMLRQSACGWGPQPSPASLPLLFPPAIVTVWKVWFFGGPERQVLQFAFRMRTSKCSALHFFLGVHQVLVLFYVKRSILKFTALFSLLGLITYKRLLLISRSVFGGGKCRVLFLDQRDAASARNNLSHIIMKLTNSLMIEVTKEVQY